MENNILLEGEIINLIIGKYPGLVVDQNWGGDRYLL
jgi:hypothetical protein